VFFLSLSSRLASPGARLHPARLLKRQSLSALTQSRRARMPALPSQHGSGRLLLVHLRMKPLGHCQWVCKRYLFSSGFSCGFFNKALRAHPVFRVRGALEKGSNLYHSGVFPEIFPFASLFRPFCGQVIHSQSANLSDFSSFLASPMFRGQLWRTQSVDRRRPL